MNKITNISRHSDEFASLVFEIAKASKRAFIKGGYPIPDWFEDTNMSVAIDFVEEVIGRGQEIESRDQAA